MFSGLPSDQIVFDFQVSLGRQFLSAGIAALVVAGAVLMPSASSSAATTTFGSGNCVQTVDGLSGASVQDGDYCVVALKSGSGTWTVPPGISRIDYLVVGGGGGGGNYGGGGAGALYQVASVSVTPSQTIVGTIGVGGAAGNASSAGGNGGDSVFNNVTAYGGGGGASLSLQGGLNNGEFDRDDLLSQAQTGFGGSGGGAMAPVLAVNGFQRVDQATALPGTSTDIQNVVFGPSADLGVGDSGLFRNKGGNSGSVFVFLTNSSPDPDFTSNLSFLLGGGGGGAGAGGGDIQWSTDGTTQATRFAPGAGGAGKASSFVSAAAATSLGVGQVSGGSAYFAGGGGGQGNFDYAPAWSGATGGMSYQLGGGAGLGGGSTANTGGGGNANGNGGSGVIVIRYSLVPDPLGGGESENPGPTDSSSPVSLAPAIGLELSGDQGGPTDQGRIEIAGSGLPEGTPYTLSLSAPLTTLHSAVADSSGSFSELFDLPSPLAAGSYTLVLRATLASGEVLQLSRTFTVSAEGNFSDLGVNVVGGTPAVTNNLAYTGVAPSTLPWWAITLLVMGLALVLYSVRATHIVDLPELAEAVAEARSPWEILSTPIRVPGVNYWPEEDEPVQTVSVGDRLRELDMAMSRTIAGHLEKLRWS